MASKYWIKLYHEILDDPKMCRLSDRLYRRVIELLLLAGDNNMNGELPKLCDMAYRLRLEDDELQTDLNSLEEKGIIHKDNDYYVVTRFADRQAAMSNADRTNRHRESKHDQIYYGNETDTDYVTNRYSDCNDSLTDKIRIDNNKKDKELINPEPTKPVEKTVDNSQILFSLDKNDSLHDKILKAYNMKKGVKRKSSAAIAVMVDKFERAGVTVTDFLESIDERDRDGRYPGDAPTVYETWAMNKVKKREKDDKAKKGVPPDDYRKSWLADRAENEALK